MQTQSAAITDGKAATPPIVASTDNDQRLTVRRDLNSFEASIAHYPEAARPAACWLYSYMMRRHNGSPALVSAVLAKLDPHRYPNKEQYVYQVTSGRYFRQAAGAKAVQALLELVEDLRRHDIVAEQSGRVPFNEHLSVWRDLRNYIDRKRARDSVCKFGAIEGATGTGKTWCTKHYQLLNNHGTTVRFEAPSSKTLSRFLMKLGACYNVRPSVSTNERILKIEENVNETRCIIVENVQKLYNPKDGPNQSIFNYIQELQDDTDSTWIFTWTPVFRKEVLNGKDAPYFEQFVSRIGGIDDVLQLDRRLPKADVLSIAEQFEVQDFAKCYPLLKSWAAQAGPLRILYSRLQKARILARGKPLSLDYLEAVDTMPVIETEEGGAE